MKSISVPIQEELLRDMTPPVQRKEPTDTDRKFGFIAIG
jgi:hypothetical protein